MLFSLNNPFARACILFNCRSGFVLWPFRNKMHDCEQLPPLGYTQLKKTTQRQQNKRIKIFFIFASQGQKPSVVSAMKRSSCDKIRNFLSEQYM